MKKDTKEANHEAVTTVNDESEKWPQNESKDWKPIGQPLEEDEDKNDDVIVSINDALFFLSEEENQNEDNDQCSRHLTAALFYRNRSLTSVTESTDEA